VNGMTILVVEDHRPLLLAIHDLLHTEGYAVLTATNGLEALEVIKRSQPDLVVADIKMSRLDGYRLFDAIHAHPEWVSIPFLILTAITGAEDRRRAMAMHAEDYILKPFDPQDLLRRIRSRLARESR
jgi:CheY-like chemotaxis protein